MEKIVAARIVYQNLDCLIMEQTNYNSLELLIFETMKLLGSTENKITKDKKR